MQDKIEVGNPLPNFKATDINGREVSNKTLIGKKTIIVFWRFAGCPVCSMTMLQFTNLFKDQENAHIVYFYTSSQEKCLKLQKHVPIPDKIHIIADSNLGYYKLFGVKPGTFFETIWNMITELATISKKKKYLKEHGLFVDVSKVGMDGSMSMLPADLLIDANGNVSTAHYGRKWSDHITVNKVKAFLDSKSTS